MKTPAEYVASAIDMYFSGIPLQQIPRLLFRKYGTLVSYTSVYNWIVHFSRLAFAGVEKDRLNTGDIWMISESFTHNDIKDTRLIFLDAVDASTGFLLATRITGNRSQYDVKALIEQAGERAGIIPSSILTDGWKGFAHGITLALGSRSENVQLSRIDDKIPSKMLWCWSMAAGSRTRIIAGLKKESTTLLMLNGWYVHYNYFISSEALSGLTPAAAAGVDCRFRSWLDIVKAF